jgi:Rad3-related DNA helicase
LKAYLEAKKIHDDHNTRHVFLELGTGSGKSGIATALGHDEKVLVVVQTLSLLEQYRNIYGFSIVKGRQEYQCVHPNKVEKWKSKYNRSPRANECHYEKMWKCPQASMCPYLLAKHQALGANRSGCTYKYLALSKSMQERGGIVIFDEGHAAAEEILQFAEIQMSERTRRKFNFPAFPFAAEGYGENSQGDILTPEAKQTLVQWIVDSKSAMDNLSGIDLLSVEGSAYKQMKRRLDGYLDLIGREENWFLKVGYPGDPKPWDYSSMFTSPDKLSLSLRPLSAKHIAPRLWWAKDLTIFMSATIGNPDALATELDLKGYKSFSYPHPIPPEYRPVDNLRAVRMTRENLVKNPGLYETQAVLIWRWISDLPPEWRGIILTTSYKKIQELKKHLSKRLNGRIYEAPKKARGVTERVRAFMEDPREGIIAIDTIQGWGHGLDFYGDLARFAIVAGVPHSNPSDPYERARVSRPGGRKYAWWTAYNAIPQAIGRVSRGETMEDGTYLLNRGALADGSAVTPTAMRYFSDWFKEAIR